MDVYIIVDMEGLSGITDGRMIRTGHQEWATRGRREATLEVNAAIEGALAAGAKRIWVKDGHDWRGCYWPEEHRCYSQNP